MTFLTTLIVLALFYGTGAAICHTAETGTCKGPESSTSAVMYDD